MPVYIDYSAATNGTGTLVNPYNTISGIILQQNQSYLFKSGTIIPDDIGPMTNADGVSIGMYGTGARPIIDRSVEASGFTFNATYGLWQKVIASEFGNVTEDGMPLKAIYWGVGGSSVNDIATVGPTMTPGSFTFDLGANILYIKPTSGTFSDHVYRYSQGLYGLRSTNANRTILIEDLVIRQASRHGLNLFNKKDVLCRNIETQIIGGYWSPSGNYYLGNGYEFSAGTAGIEVEFCKAFDTWDSAFTTQLYETVRNVASSHEYRNVECDRYGLAGIEISIPSGSGAQTIRDIYVNSATISNGGSQYCFANKPPSDGVSVVSTLTKGSGAGVGYTDTFQPLITDVYFDSITAVNSGRMWSTASTFGRCALANSTGDNMTQFGLRKVVQSGSPVDIVNNVTLTNSAANTELGGTFTFNNKFVRTRTFV